MHIEMVLYACLPVRLICMCGKNDWDCVSYTALHYDQTGGPKSILITAARLGCPHNITCTPLTQFVVVCAPTTSHAVLVAR